MSEHFLFNSFNTLIGLALTVCAFVMQMQIDNVCGSKPLRNSVLGILVIGMTMFWLGGVSLFTGAEVLTKHMFAGFVGALGATLIGLGSVIVQNSKKECKDDVVCKQTIAGGNNSNSDTPCEGARLWGGIVVAAGCLMILGAGAHVVMATGTDKLLSDKYKEVGGLQGLTQSAKKAATKARATKKEKQAIEAFEELPGFDSAFPKFSNA